MAVGQQIDNPAEATMARAHWCVLVAGAGVLAGCGSDGASSGQPNPATGLAPPAASTSQTPAGADWTMPSGVFRAESPQIGVLELHVEDGDFQIYDVTDGSPDLGYSASCVADEPSTVSCTEVTGTALVFAWRGTAHQLELTFVDGDVPDDRRVLEAAPWIRVP